MLYTGMLLQDLFQKVGAFPYKRIWFPLVVSLLIIPMVVMPVLSLTNLDDTLKNMIII
ncbi:hypothetical protein [Salipaludibacillus aurantiacus]|uniref:hypothetical protein n=1 Tax=Salipaludibacillus aurantiacus TaxID=1601833 RepID=UPI0015A506B3|nr:hypothetical protein [Salipaludibacillus aurantiacus]